MRTDASFEIVPVVVFGVSERIRERARSVRNLDADCRFGRTVRRLLRTSWRLRRCDLTRNRRTRSGRDAQELFYPVNTRRQIADLFN